MSRSPQGDAARGSAAAPGVAGEERGVLRARIDAALAAALTIADDADSPFAVLPAAALRRRMAALIAHEAAAGVADIGLLKASALRGPAAALPARAR